MSLTRTPRLVTSKDDDGAALLTVIVLTAFLVVASLSMAFITITNLGSARSAQQAGAAVDAADAGLAQGVAYLRSNGLSTINACSPTCTNEPYGNSANPKKITINGKAGQYYTVWIEPIAPYPANKPGIYRIHTSGVAGGPAARAVTVDVSVTPFKVPIGIMADTVTGGGNAGVHHESILSTGCIYKRSKIEFDGIDKAYGVPAAVYSSQVINDDAGSGQYCPNTKKPLHETTSGNAGYCNSSFDQSKYDMDLNGGSLVGTPCYNSARAEFGNLPQFNDPTHIAYNFPTTSKIANDKALLDMFGLRKPPFTQAQLDQLRTIALSQGNYWTSASGWTSPDERAAVMYFDLAASDPGGVVDLKDLTGWSRPVDQSATSTQCDTRSLIIIIEGGNARLNGNENMFGSVFLISGSPYGKIMKANGTAYFTGSLYANELDLTGTADLYMDDCFLANQSPALADVETFNYREIDR
ncbi:hypothetical protein [Nocardioides rubriscoriae]|uniref:hypothetical protein n=1 Tax=Nocardioides rubriscoriae TaxID=642762 RepID=UPI0011DF90FD|nr:hypothetical protein [Nocardioides rubriscoriae]